MRQQQWLHRASSSSSRMWSQAVSRADFHLPAAARSECTVVLPRAHAVLVAYLCVLFDLRVFSAHEE